MATQDLLIRSEPIVLPDHIGRNEEEETKQKVLFRTAVQVEEIEQREKETSKKKIQTREIIEWAVNFFET